MKHLEDGDFTEQIKFWVANASLQENLNRLYKDPVFNYMFEKSSTVAMVYDMPASKFKFISKNFQQQTGMLSSIFIDSSATEMIKNLFDEKCVAILQANIFPKILNYYEEYAVKKKVKDLKLAITAKLKARADWMVLQIKILETNIKGYPTSLIMFMTKITEIKSNHSTVDFSVHELIKKKKYDVVYTVSYPMINSTYSFTAKEQEILYCLKEGKTSKQIAYMLGLSAHTINTYRKNMLKKSGATSTAALIRMLIEEGT